MKKKKTAIVALAVAAVMSCGMFAGCDLITTDSRRDFAQVIATVDITTGEAFEKEFPGLKDVIQPADVLKRDMIASFMSNGSNVMNTYGWTYRDTFNAISESLVNRQVTIQYAMAYLLKNSPTDEDGKDIAEKYKTATENKTGLDREIAGLESFLSREEIARAQYSTKRLFNNTLDSQEKTYIKSETEESSGVTPRTLPTGVNTSNSDYYDISYKIYTGTVVTSAAEDAVASASASACGSYEAVEGSTPATRRKAFNAFLASLRQNDLLEDGEDTTKFETLNYYKMELKSAYESAIVNKLSEMFEDEADEVLSNEADVLQEYETLYRNQKDAFDADPSSFDSQLDSLSDTNFLLTAPSENYGYVINILLPFSTSQTARVNALKADYGDPKGNSFVQRAQILEEIRATDQRGTWFTGDTDYSWNTAEEGHETSAIYKGTDANRSYLFFEDCLTVDPDNENDYQYQPLKNYYGKYSYNGTVVEKDGSYLLSPVKIPIDDFIAEMEGYLKSENFNISENKYTNGQEAYYKQSVDDYYTTDQDTGAKIVDYSKFVYYEGKVDFDSYNANHLFVAGEPENTALSIIKELSFAYNTDTAGLNSYLGYSVVTSKTSFVSEFEYAAQEVCKRGAGSYMVVPSDYGWHVIYCTFSFKTNDAGEIKPFEYLSAEKDLEGSFSNLFYESVKSTIVSTYSTMMQTTLVTSYQDCATVFEDRYSDLLNLDNN